MKKPALSRFFTYRSKRILEVIEIIKITLSIILIYIYYFILNSLKLLPPYSLYFES